MAKNDFKAFAIGNGANVMSQADYEALSALASGFLSGKASSAQVNKAIRQSSTIAAVVAQFISDNSGDDVLDNGNLPALLASLESALRNSVPGRLQNIVSFTANGTYIPSPGTKHVKVIVTGGGGGGGGCQGTSGTESISGGGGGAGGTAIAYFAVTESSYTVTVGAGGSAGVGAVQGGTGGTSIINGISGLGGEGGQKSGVTTLAGGKGGVSIGGSVNLPGGYGTDGQNGSLIIPGNGGSSYWGGGGRGGARVGVAGDCYGSGGGGAYDAAMSGNSYNGGQGKSGIIYIEEYS
ncbi:hypothetical protein [Klebsiella aerogenes]|uniref:glycine-rich domain-containing protein n=1 Tax=Klebsiella aerogenes TaxID=548 RepID=UPI000E2F2BBF|nr:hypothetical protein [Klebsiella aerogenes]ELA2324261.1 hypothetical protein [Klebsiella aerogenes]WBN62724.1 hypothetical protein KHW00_11750 [Klebsiella aerogenes]HDG8261097.1 hypothetical protein [Klebsiella aerogenes]